MSWKVGLHLGEIFAEVTARRDDETYSDRWHLSHANLGRALKQFFEKRAISEISEIRISHKLVPQILNKRLGSSPALLVTAGFEHWLEMSLPVSPPYFSLEAQKQSSPIDRDLVFGLSARMRADGQEERPLDEQELEFLVAKLQLNKVQNVAVGLLHSQKNPGHERRVCEYFREKGFQVHSAEELADGVPCEEKKRWWAAALEAYMAPTFAEMWKNILAQIAEVCGAEVKTYISGVKELKGLREKHIAHAFSWSWPIYQSQRHSSNPNLIYFGLEDFLLIQGESPLSEDWATEFGLVRLTTPPAEWLPLQPDQKVLNGFWQRAEFDNQRIGFEPGPMSLGKGLQPCFFDLLHVENQLPENDFWRDRLVSRSKNRILESLAAYSRGEDTSLDYHQLPQKLLDLASLKIILALQNAIGRAPAAIGGPLGPSMAKVLRRHLSSHQLQLIENSDHLLSRSLLEEA